MNWFMFAIGVQYIAAMGVEISRRHWPMTIVYLCYGVSAVALGFVGGGHK